MDLERIKQNFRIRSGRTRKSKKHTKPQVASSSPKDSIQKSPGVSNGTVPDSSTDAAAKREDNNQVHDSQSSRRSETPKNEAIQGNVKKPESVGEVSPSVEHSVSEGATPVKQKGGSISGTDDKLESRPAPSHDTARSSSTTRSRGQSFGSEDSSLDLQTSKQSTNMTEAQAPTNPTSSDADDFDLAPPKPRQKPPSIEKLSELLFSPGHLDTLLHHPQQLSRFSAFLQRYLPNLYPQLAQYLETRKAIKAVEYANAIAEGLRPKELGGDSSIETTNCAAKLDPGFEAVCSSSFDALIGDALPSFVSYSLVKTVSECLTNEITGRSTPIMRDLVDGLSEVFCLTDPNREDNPIIYASEEFYRLTRYGPEDVLNNNCRFLQGRKTNRASPRRLKQAIKNGDEITETLLNYRRDGRPFINLLMVAPLHDKNGKLKYHIGAQVDVSGLVQGGRALDSFQRYLSRHSEKERQEAVEKAERDLDNDQKRKQRALARLRDLSETFDLEETAVVQATSRSNSFTRDEDEMGSTTSLDRQKAQRRVYVNSDSSEYGDEEAAEAQKQDTVDWTLGEAGDGKLSGKLPGVYDSFILFRPAPSFRIVFVSPKLRKMGDVVQTPFLSHVAAPSGTLNGLCKSLRAGVPVSAKIHFMAERGESRDGTRLQSGTKHEDGKNGRAVWVSCTPLLGEDDTIGVWMCVVVEKSKVGSIKKKGKAVVENQVREEISTPSGKQTSNVASEANNSKREDIPIKPVRVNSETEIKTETQTEPEKPEESAEVGQEQSSKIVRPQQSIYFDAEQGGDVDKQELSDRNKTDKPASGEDVTDNDQYDPAQRSAQDRDPRAVVTPVEEYEEPGANAKSYSVELPDFSSPVADHETGDEYITTRSPVTPSRRTNGRVLIEEDSDVLQDEDLDHQRDNMRVGRGRSSSRSAESLNSPASDIPPSVPASAHLPDADEDYDLDLETPTKTRHDRSPTPPDAAEEDNNNNDLEQSHATIKPAQDSSPNRNSDRDSAISLDSPEQPRKQSRSPQPADPPEQTNHADEVDQDGSDYGNEEDNQEESRTPTHEQDVETWVKDGRPPTSRHNSDKNNIEPEHSHSHSHDGNGNGKTNRSSMRMDYLRAGSNRWQRPTRRRLDLDFEKDKDADAGDDVESTSFDICATSPYSVD